MSTNQAEFYRGLEAAGDALQHSENRSPAEQATLVHKAAEPLLTKTKLHAQLACRRGCSHCCHYPVGITYPEAMRLAMAVRTHPELVARIHTESQSARERTWEQLVGLPCPLLINDACSAHESRPMPCRALGSLDATACADALSTDHAPPRDEEAWWRGLGAAHALADVSSAGSRELRSALSALLTAEEHDSEQAFRSARAAPGA